MTGAGNPTSFENVGHAFNRNNQDTANTYDGNGNPVSYKGTALVFDPENRLVQYGVLGTGSPYMAAAYNGDGLRAQKTNNSGTRFFLYDGDEPALKINGSNPASVSRSLYGENNGI